MGSQVGCASSRAIDGIRARERCVRSQNSKLVIVFGPVQSSRTSSGKLPGEGRGAKQSVTQHEIKIALQRGRRETCRRLLLGKSGQHRGAVCIQEIGGRGR